MKSQAIANKYSRYQAAQEVAGDFDGDGKTEFAVVFKDDVASQNNINVTVYKWNNGSFTKANNKVSYDGKNSAWNAYVTVNVSALGLKAARADLDGDGKDEIAVLLFVYEDMQSYAQNSESKSFEVFPYLTYWYCDKGTIAPKYDASKTKGKKLEFGRLSNEGGSKLFANSARDGAFYYEYRSLGGGQYDGQPLIAIYPYVDRTFSLVAAPFTGTIGKKNS